MLSLRPRRRLLCPRRRLLCLRRRRRLRRRRSADFRRAPARNSHPLPGIPNDEILSSQCYHLSGGDSEILCHLPTGSPSRVLKDFQIRGIGGYHNRLKRAISERAIYAITFANVPKFPSFKRVFGRNNTFDMEERKTFISSGCNHLWQDKLYGITRVGVYGVDSICVVMRNEDFEQLGKDLTRLRDNYYGVHVTPQALIKEVEDLACPPGIHRNAESDKRRNQKPFGVVSVIAGTDEGDKVNHNEADELKAIEFLWEEMNSTSAFTFHKVVKTAICALQHLWNKKFKPNEIQAFVWKKVEKRGEDSDGVVEVLKIRDERSVEDQLSVINKSAM